MSKPQEDKLGWSAGQTEAVLAGSGQAEIAGLEQAAASSSGGGSPKAAGRGATTGSAVGAARLSKRSEEREGLHFFRYGSRRLITSLLLYGLIVEWLLPLEQLKAYTELYQISPLLTAVGLFLAVGLFVPPTWAALLMNGCIALGAVLVLFQPHYGSLSQSMQGFVRAFRHDAAGIAQGQFMLSGEMRTLLLIAGLGMMAIAVQSLMWLRQWGLGLTALTAVYLLLLYGFTGLEVFPGLLRACAEGLVLSALVTAPRIERLAGMPDLFAKGKGGSGGEGSLLSGWSLGWWSGAAWLAVLIMAASVGAAWGWSSGTTSEQAPWAADAIQWGQEQMDKADGGAAPAATTAQEAMSETGLSGSGKTGYGFDDRRLGGPLTPDTTVLFTVASQEAGYLRGDSEAFYNGKGWEQEEHDWLKRNVTSDSGKPRAGVFVQTVTPARPTVGYPLFTGGADARITALKLQRSPKNDSGKYWQDAFSGALYPSGDEDQVVQYTVETVIPNEAKAQAQGDINAAGSAKDASVPLSMTEREERVFTQLPTDLPARVGELAAQILKDAGNPTDRYAQAEAIVDYLKANYPYTLTNTQVPEGGADLVDDFLFRQKQGYCVHFASALAVLLRTQGIPARYVKGFAPGEPGLPADGGDASLYTVRASDAHAWVEVWFPGVGWLSFEPTPGFAAPDSGAAGAAASSAPAGEGAQPDAAAAGDAAPAADRGEAAGARSAAGRLAAQLRAAAARGAHALADAGRGAMASPPWAMAACAAAVTGAAGLALAWRRRHERFAFGTALRRYGSALNAGRHTAARSQFLQLADALWRELYKQCGAKPPHRTAREYAAALRLPPLTAPLVADFVRWDEEARFDAFAPRLPTQQQMAELVSTVVKPRQPGASS
ncbi:transglutaminase domain-containing protein [Paenibacillus rhizovicinus]|uniref:Transglutaminase domain-containing protein n=1 Tax=Paenibacillus rhizovicinus TaxID=2704463 RepID=A0A6C0NZ36_9BACL|nr:transglutaminase-like domain-containing protein [Paenibacillus rhizovicinus]QHW31504.1 transglutaminase domain-containing protein [Paenibacillus rhizovicinus]